MTELLEQGENCDLSEDSLETLALVLLQHHAHLRVHFSAEENHGLCGATGRLFNFDCVLVEEYLETIVFIYTRHFFN